MLWSLCSLVIFAYSAAAKEKILTADDINCSADGSYCENAAGRPLTGKVSRYNGENEVLQNYKTGLRSGLTTVWNNEGKVVSKTYYKYGQKNGIERFYYDNRTIKSAVEYKDGKLHGRVDYYTEKGKLKGRLTYKDGALEKGYCLVNGKKQNVSDIGAADLISCGD